MCVIITIRISVIHAVFTPTAEEFYISYMKRLTGPRRRWEDNVKMALQEVGGGRRDWMELAQDRDRWRALVGTVRDFGFHKCGEFLD